MNSERWVVAAVALALTACADFRRGQPADEMPVPAAGGAPGPDAAPASAVDAGGVFAPSFAATVDPPLREACGRCHTPSGQASGTAFVLGATAADDYAAASRLVDATAPASSRLLAKARGDGHGGGAIWPVSSYEYQLVTQWITQGARP